MSTNEDSLVSLKFTHHGASYIQSFPPNSTISDFSSKIADVLRIPPSKQKLMISKIGFLVPPFKDPQLLLSSIQGNKITVMGSTDNEVSKIMTIAEEAARDEYQQNRPLQKVKAYKTRNWTKEQEENRYTFLNLKPLPYLNNPSRSLQLLQRLKDDAGIKAVMCKHKFTVPILTEMNPIEHTESSQDGISRTLGLNRNKGEVIELRLRTDAYDGYRDYKTIRKALCHELTHNVYGPHNRDFWDLCGQIEKEVDAADWRTSGKTIGNMKASEHRYGPASPGYSIDGHKLGEFTPNIEHSTSQLRDRREIFAKAAEDRLKRSQKQNDEEK
ncbi:hypothetical protein similar to ubiquitin/metalloprotease fusion protein [Blumeria hordei DH14]|uniref:WLM domain-containing protein n=1 Tax=Blumeria graminis f. sp. hordei (strain DH14) TaxID=546991 RepID=N1JD43_BLUG1|nr:hypothetical protein similar to ubiquitin/metalloprotease fusion protein [Blumeria hordei DH14]